VSVGRRALAAALIAVAVAACQPTRVPLTQGDRDAAVHRAIAVDPILRWKCPAGGGYWYRTNETGYRELPADVRRRCVPIAPVTVPT